MNLRDFGVEGCIAHYCHITGKHEPMTQCTCGGCRCLQILPSKERLNITKALWYLHLRVNELESKK